MDDYRCLYSHNLTLDKRESFQNNSHSYKPIFIFPSPQVEIKLEDVACVYDSPENNFVLIIQTFRKLVAKSKEVPAVLIN